MIFSLDDMIEFLPSLLEGAVLTIAVSLLSFVLALVFGLATGIARISRVPPLRVLAACYIQFIRGTPLLLQLSSSTTCCPMPASCCRHSYPARWGSR